MIKGFAAAAVIGGGLGAGITALSTRDSTDGDGAMGVAKGLGIAAGVTTAIGVGGLMLASKSTAGIGEEILNMLLIGGPSIILTGAGIGIGGAAAGTALIAASKD